MFHLPTEIIIIIFQYLPQKYLSIGTTLCKEWYRVLSQPLFYKTIHIYSISQLKRCINLAKTRIIDNQFFGHYVENIHFHTDRDIPKQTLINILNTFPNLHCIQGLNKQQRQHAQYSRSVTFSPQNQLEHLFHWYQDYTEQWTNTLDNNYKKIKSLEFCMRNNLLVLHKEENQSSTLPIVNFTSINSVIPQYNNTYHINSSDRKIYTIMLPVMSCLSYLSIDCSIYNGDEHMFESIHQSCPQLKSLTVESFNMYISENYYNNKSNKISNQLLQSNVYLKELCIGNRLNDSQCYDYLSFKYPHLESLSLYLDETRYLEPSFSSFKLAIYKMIIQYSWLKKLKVKFANSIGQYQF